MLIAYERDIDKYQSEDYEIISSPLEDDDFYLVYSKVKSDSMPITQTTVNNLVCLDPTASYHQRTFYPTEVQAGTPKCMIDPEFRLADDPRYTPIDFFMSEYDIYNQNGVYELLESFEFSEKYIRIQEFKKIQHQFQVRPTIPFKLECESPNIKSAITSTAQL